MKRAVAAVALLVAVMADPARSFTVDTTFGPPQKWRDLPVVLHVDPVTVPPPFSAAMGRAMATWSGVAGSSFRFVHGGDSVSGNVAHHGNDFNDSYFESLPPFVGAVTYAFESGSRLRDRDVGFNSNFSWSATGVGGLDVETIALHEYGHVLGLLHEDGVPAVMNSVAAGVRRRLQGDDEEGVRFLYPGGVDLQVLSVQVISGTPAPGNSVLLRAQVRNGGQVESGIYRLDATIAPGLTRTEPWTGIGFTQAPSLPAGATANVEVAASVPADLPPGRWTLGVEADPGDVLKDLALGDNAAPGPEFETARPTLPLAAGDRVEGRLGVGGSDRVALWLGEGTRVTVRVRGQEGLRPRLSLFPAGGGGVLSTVEGRGSGRLSWTAPSEGVREVEVENLVPAVGAYRLDIGIASHRDRGTLEEPGTVSFPAYPGGRVRARAVFAAAAGSLSALPPAGPALETSPAARGRRARLGPFALLEAGVHSLLLEGEGPVRWNLRVSAPRRGAIHLR